MCITKLNTNAFMRISGKNHALPSVSWNVIIEPPWTSKLKTNKNICRIRYMCIINVFNYAWRYMKCWLHMGGGLQKKGSFRIYSALK